MIRALLRQVQSAYRGYSEADIASLNEKIISSVAAGEVTWLTDGESAAFRGQPSRFVPGPQSRIAKAV